MGYFSKYNLDVMNLDGSSVPQEEWGKHAAGIVQASKEYEGDFPPGKEEEFWYHEQKWYEMEIEMQEYSERYPHLVFEIHATGEDGEMCNYYYHNGEEQVANAIITYPECRFIQKQEA